MSYSEVLGLYPNKDTHPVTIIELRNSHGTAGVIWDLMCQAYLKTSPFSYSQKIEELWPLYKDYKNIPVYQRAVLLMTYDMAYISAENYKKAAKDIREWLKEYPPCEKYVNHWPEIAGILESKQQYPAIGFRCTSVSENLFLGDWNEDKDDYDPVDWSGSFEVYELLTQHMST